MNLYQTLMSYVLIEKIRKGEMHKRKIRGKIRSWEEWKMVKERVGEIYHTSPSKKSSANQSVTLS